MFYTAYDTSNNMKPLWITHKRRLEENTKQKLSCVITPVPPNVAMAVWSALVRGEQSTTAGAGESPTIAPRASRTSACPLSDNLQPDKPHVYTKRTHSSTSTAFGFGRWSRERVSSQCQRESCPPHQMCMDGLIGCLLAWLLGWLLG